MRSKKGVRWLAWPPLPAPGLRQPDLPGSSGYTGWMYAVRRLFFGRPVSRGQLRLPG
ncbi:MULTISPECIES: hypothetical protein [unclassified Paenibacillus]|uniref:hypothetical protein n=1 Tax=unclassified Paenibacillus TaxID=185978 RepID=UPI000AF1BCD4|nr:MULTISPECIES: hypothetical protein [unclassified Paenibacillus]